METFAIVFHFKESSICLKAFIHFSPISSFPVAVSFQNFTNAVCLDCGFSPGLKKRAAHVKLMNSACTPTWKPLYRWSFINCLNICISNCSRETIPAHLDNEQSTSRDKTISYRNYLALASLNHQGSFTLPICACPKLFFLWGH